MMAPSSKFARACTRIASAKKIRNSNRLKIHPSRVPLCDRKSSRKAEKNIFALAPLAASFGILLFSHLVCLTVCEYHVRVDVLFSLFCARVRLFPVSVFFSASFFRRPCVPLFGVCFSRPSNLGLFVGVPSRIFQKKTKKIYVKQ